MVRDKVIFIEQGECLMAGWMWNHSWGVYEENQIMKMLWTWYLKNVKQKIHVKAKVMSVRSQFWWGISKINIEVCHGKFQV